MFSELLEIEPVHVSKNTARAYVKFITRAVGLPLPRNKNEFSNDIVATMGKSKFRFNFQEAVEETQSCGIPKNLQFLFDSKDLYLVPIMNIAITKMPPGLQCKISGTVGSFKKEIDAPGSIESPEKSLAEDILYFRKAMCGPNLCAELEDFTRFYRSYLQSCISLVDCFLFRYSTSIKDRIGNLEKYANTKVLAKPVPFVKTKNC